MRLRPAPTIALLAGAMLLPPAAEADVSPFKTPTGNIECVVGTGEGPADITCWIHDRSGSPAAPRPASCKTTWGHTFAMAARGRATMTCGKPNPRNTAPGVPVAGYGDTADFGGITCASRKSGLECRNADGHGFLLSRGLQELY